MIVEATSAHVADVLVEDQALKAEFKTLQSSDPQHTGRLPAHLGAVIMYRQYDGRRALPVFQGIWSPSRFMGIHLGYHMPSKHHTAFERL